MIMTKINDAWLKSLKGDGTQREFKDGENPLRIVVGSSGAKSFQYRWKAEGKSRRHTFGHYPSMTLADARDAALRFKIDLKQKRVEPAPLQKSVLKASLERPMTVSEAYSLYLGSDAVAGLKERTADEYRRAFEKDIEPHIGNIAVVDLTYEDIEDVIQQKYDDLTSNPTRKNMGRGIGANRLHSTISGFLRWCRTKGRAKTGLKTNIIADMPKLADEKPDTRYFSEKELRWFFEALSSANGMARPYELLLRTVSRRSEILTLTWGMVFDDKIILDDTKNGRPHIISLTPAARDLVGDRPKEARDGDRVFTVHPEANTRAMTRLRDRMNELAKRDGANAGIDHWKLHSFRRTATTIMASFHDDQDRQLITPHTRERVLNHTDATVRGQVYDKYDDFSEKKTALILWGDYLDKIKSSVELPH